ncbi:MAG TPA: O-antigen ligase family protein [Planctomicrobium sp.]|nr:O-antigen ligase family protein [Planctomicrobium sp.]
MAKPRSPSRNAPSQHKVADSGLSWSYWDILVTALVLVRLLVPTEGSEQGQTLWIAAGWLVLASIRCWWLARQEGWHPPQFHLADLGVLLLIGGNCLAAVLVLLGEGDRRAALNGFWEWGSIGATWFVLRDLLRSHHLRRLMTRALLGICLTLALFGIWQHLIWYPQQGRQLTELVELKIKTEQRQSLSSSEQQRFNELAASYGTEFLSLDESGRTAFLNRAVYSVEPIGRFALANSFAALLIVGFFLSLETMIRAFRQESNTRSQVIAAAVTILIITCLLLTKSRTAIVGVVLIILCQAILAGGGRTFWTPRRLRIIGGILAFLLLMAGLLFWSGGLDREVISEAPKSLQYRLEYWQGTRGVISEHPVFGVGPGNFRQHYLKHKLPGSSEEILDPHNFLLDAWSQGGVLALAGVLVLVFVWFRRNLVPPEPSPSPTSPFPIIAAFSTGLLACGLIFAEEWLFEGFTDRTILALAGLWVFSLFLLHWLVPVLGANRQTALAACGALFIHLLGAGGLGMPAILQLLLLMILFLLPIQSTIQPARQIRLNAAAVIGLIAAVGCVWTGLLPVLTTSILTERGRTAFASQGNTRSAEQLLREAITADSLSPEPLQQLAMLFFQRWKRDRSDDRLFETAVELQTQAIQRDPVAGKRWLILGEWFMERSRSDSSSDHARRAVEAFQSGIERYPAFAPLWAQLAVAQEAAGESASDASRKAIELDDLNRANQHADKYLPEALRKQLKVLAE